MLLPRTRTVTTPWLKTSAMASGRLGSYSLLALLAKGGTSSVYLAEHVDTGRRVALKLLDPVHADHREIVSRFFFEHVVSHSVRHPALVEITASATTPTGLPYLVMEVLAGRSLGTLPKRERMSLADVLAIGKQIASAIGAMHRQGFIHCDIKAENVFLLRDELHEGAPCIKVIDYGVSRRTSDGPSALGTIAGTPAYMAPEQWRGAPCTKSDVYSLGCLLYELATGERPFAGTLPELMTLHTEELPARPTAHRAEMSTAFEALLVRMIAKDPGMRPSMAEVEQMLGRVAFHQRTTTRLERIYLDAIA